MRIHLEVEANQSSYLTNLINMIIEVDDIFDILIFDFFIFAK